jgi:hypothetical protein
MFEFVRLIITFWYQNTLTSFIIMTKKRQVDCVCVGRFASAPIKTNNENHEDISNSCFCIKFFFSMFSIFIIVRDDIYSKDLSFIGTANALE